MRSGTRHLIALPRKLAVLASSLSSVSSAIALATMEALAKKEASARSKALAILEANPQLSSMNYQPPCFHTLARSFAPPNLANSLYSIICALFCKNTRMVGV